jgi:hypothetical protein
MKTFEEMAQDEHEIRRKEAKRELEKFFLMGENHYTKFCVWCNAFYKGKGKNDAHLFAKFLEEEKVELNFWQKKHLAEKYFGYDYQYDSNNKKWKIIKKKENK